MEKEQVYMVISTHTWEGSNWIPVGSCLDMGRGGGSLGFFYTDKSEVAGHLNSLNFKNRVFLFPQMTEITKADIILS